jgi:hypothetical protein
MTKNATVTLTADQCNALWLDVQAGIKRAVAGGTKVQQSLRALVQHHSGVVRIQTEVAALFNDGAKAEVAVIRAQLGKIKAARNDAGDAFVLADDGKSIGWDRDKETGNVTLRLAERTGAGRKPDLDKALAAYVAACLAHGKTREEAIAMVGPEYDDAADKAAA